jgi:hypothetical protein
LADRNRAPRSLCLGWVLLEPPFVFYLWSRYLYRLSTIIMCPRNLGCFLTYL